jgi:DNA-binding NarL/FixJ family response regulator
MSELPTLALLDVRVSPWAPTQVAPDPLPLPLTRFRLALEAAIDRAGLERLTKVAPRVVVLDLRSAVQPRGALILPVRRAAPSARVVVVGPAHDQALAEAAVRLGACGYLSTDLSASALAQALDDAVQGDVSYSRTGKRALQSMLRGGMLRSA